jgi:hypothetical protein
MAATSRLNGAGTAAAVPDTVPAAPQRSAPVMSESQPIRTGAPVAT